MLAYSPPLFSTAYGWPLVDDLHTTDAFLHQDNNGVSLEVEANSYDPSLFDLPSTYDDQILHHHQHLAPKETTSISSGGAVADRIGGGGNTGDDDHKVVAKKLNHNASERDRRKRVNDLYAFLRSLLPVSSDQKVKVSIPGTVSRALKYIPHLQKEVDTLTRKKESLRRPSSPSIADPKKDRLGIKKQSGKDGVPVVPEASLSGVSSVSVLGEKDVVIQMISSSTGVMSLSKKKDEIGLLSEVLEYLEEEEDGLVLVDATSFECVSEGVLMLLSTLHLRVQGDHRIQAENLKEKLCSFHR